MTTLAIAVIAAYGVHLVYTAIAYGWTGFRPGPAAPHHRRRPASELLERIGLGAMDARALLAAVVVLAGVGFAFGVLLFAGPLPALVVAVFVATAPIATARLHHERRTDIAHRAWPQLIEEVRLLTGTLGRSIPQATFEAGRRAPEGLRDAFEDAHREWLISTDFARALAVLKHRLGHNTADVVAETLLTAHELGGGEVGRRLQALAQDRLTDQQHRRDAIARQAGVRFARWFVLIVPLGMALAGLSIGTGRSAYGTDVGQALVTAALSMIIACWVWAGRIMRLPTERRVFA